MPDCSPQQIIEHSISEALAVMAHCCASETEPDAVVGDVSPRFESYRSFQREQGKFFDERVLHALESRPKEIEGFF
jgi:hypothetical protein